MNDGRKKVSERRRRFVDEYVACGGNGSEAARRAGYSPKTANITASTLLADAEIRAQINMKLDELQNQRTAKAQEILEFLSAVMRGQVEDTAVTPSGKPIKISTRVVDRLKAAEALSKINGLFQAPKPVVEDSRADFQKIFVNTLRKICGDDETDDESA